MYVKKRQNISKKVVLSLFLLIGLSSEVFWITKAQNKEEKPPKHVNFKADKFTGKSMAWTQSEDFEAIVGNNWKFVVSIGVAAIWKTEEAAKKDYYFYLIPEPQSFAGRAVNNSNSSRKLGYEKRPSDSLFIENGAEITFIIDGQKVNLPRFQRESILDTFGNFNNQAFIPLTEEQFSQFVSAQNHEISIGGIQIVNEIKGDFNKYAKKAFLKKLVTFKDYLNSRK